MSDFSKSIVRTIVPLVVGLVLSLLIKAGFNVTSTQVEMTLAPVISAAYYLAVRFIEKRIPKVGMLLGVPTAPQYDIKSAIVNVEHEVLPVVEAEVEKVVEKVARPAKTAVAKAEPKPAPATKSSTVKKQQPKQAPKK